jgi:hypothetical protein
MPPTLPRPKFERNIKFPRNAEATPRPRERGSLELPDTLNSAASGRFHGRSRTNHVTPTLTRAPNTNGTSNSLEPRKQSRNPESAARTARTSRYLQWRSKRVNDSTRTTRETKKWRRANNRPAKQAIKSYLNLRTGPTKRESSPAFARAPARPVPRSSGGPAPPAGADRPASRGKSTSSGVEWRLETEGGGALNPNRNWARCHARAPSVPSPASHFCSLELISLLFEFSVARKWGNATENDGHGQFEIFYGCWRDLCSGYVR